MTFVPRPGSKAIVVGAVVSAVLMGIMVVWYFHPGLAELKTYFAGLQSARDSHPIIFMLEFLGVYLAITALCIPVEPLMAVAAGALFGIVEGTIIASLMSAIGASVAFCGARWLFRDGITRYFARQLAIIDQGLARDGSLYVLTLRLLPVFPYGVVNVVLGLTDLSVRKFYVCSQIGLLASTLIYVNAGTALLKIRHLSEIFSPQLILSLFALGLLPWIAKAVLSAVRRASIKL